MSFPKALVRKVEKRYNMSLNSIDQAFLSAYQKYNLDAKVAWKSLPQWMKDEENLSSVVYKVKPIMLDLVEMDLVLASGRASATLNKLMESNEEIPQASVKLEAAKTVLDRVGIGKKGELLLGDTNSATIFILPAKKPVVLKEKEIDGEIIENES